MDMKARTVREKLIWVAQRRETIAYAAVAKIVDLHVRSPALYRILDDINRYEHEAGRPLLTAVVVRQGDSTPGDGFFALATRLRLHRAGDNDRRYWLAERDRVYAHWTRA